MKPYYEEDGITIYHGDCRDVLPRLAQVELVVTDPPYGINLIRKTNDCRLSKYFDNGKSMEATIKYEDGQAYVRILLQETLPLILAASRRAIVFPGPAMLWAYPEPQAIGCVWVSSGTGRCSWGFQCHHPILFYGKDPYLEAGRGARPNGFTTEQRNIEKIDHPCPKPLSWMKWAICRGSISGTVLDPFMGSGTTMVAALELGHSAIGIDIEEAYCEIAANRLRQGVLDFTQSSAPRGSGQASLLYDVRR